MASKIDTICDITYRLAWFDIPENQYKRSYNKLRKLTREVWTESHSELIRRLKTMESPAADYQLFWFECMAGSPIGPKLHDLKGMPLSLPYQSLPTDYNEHQGLHDSELISFRYDKHNLIANILLDSWEREYADLTFINISHFIYQKDGAVIELALEDIRDLTILSDGEAPVIDYSLKHLEIEKNDSILNKRLFYLFFSSSAIYIFADSWSIKTF
ncbi:hypothetical protein [Paenibacillus sinopodophylli]|uniref:hypothetical protein n=1 Tax=Paenibacillus sinopodophylli TaxID=1837342 RepID=UPI00110C9970|nr:hypothetical protein [Paenibacillus sinopodophylli]